MYNYPTKRKPYTKPKITSSKRGMLFEDVINETNEQYLKRDIAIIYKKPTPITIVGVDYPSRNKAKIVEAYYKTPSTTDYNGVYKGYYLDFDAKMCNSATSFPLSNVHPHQVSHLDNITRHGGIGFLLIYLSQFDEIYLLESKDLQFFAKRAKEDGKKSIALDELRECGHEIKESYPIRIPYLDIIDEIISKKEK